MIEEGFNAKKNEGIIAVDVVKDDLISSTSNSLMLSFSSVLEMVENISVLIEDYKIRNLGKNKYSFEIKLQGIINYFRSKLNVRKNDLEINQSLEKIGLKDDSLDEYENKEIISIKKGINDEGDKDEGEYDEDEYDGYYESDDEEDEDGCDDNDGEEYEEYEENYEENDSASDVGNDEFDEEEDEFSLEEIYEYEERIRQLLNKMNKNKTLEEEGDDGINEDGIYRRHQIKFYLKKEEDNDGFVYFDDSPSPSEYPEEILTPLSLSED
jgi:hypothetical protein